MIKKKKRKIPIKIGDMVTVISGSEKNKMGEVTKVFNNTGKITIKNVNFKFKHIKPVKENDIGEIKQFEVPIHHSNVKLNLNNS